MRSEWYNARQSRFAANLVYSIFKADQNFLANSEIIILIRETRAKTKRPCAPVNHICINYASLNQLCINCAPVNLKIKKSLFRQSKEKRNIYA